MDCGGHYSATGCAGCTENGLECAGECTLLVIISGEMETCVSRELVEGFEAHSIPADEVHSIPDIEALLLESDDEEQSETDSEVQYLPLDYGDEEQSEPDNDEEQSEGDHEVLMKSAPVTELNAPLTTQDKPTHLAPQATAVARPRLKLGEYVKVLACETLEYIGKIGKVVRDDRDEQPFRLTFGGGIETLYFFRESDLRRATRVGPQCWCLVV